MDAEVEHDPEKRQFVARVEETNSYLRYAQANELTLDFLSTFVHPSVRGRGVGEALVRRGLEYASENGLRVIPTCWFVDTIVRRHPRYLDLLVPR